MSRPNGQRQFNGLMRYLHSHRIRWDMRIKRAISECLVGQVDEFLAWDIDGVIYAQPQHSPDARAALSHLAKMDIPLVVIDPGDNPDFATSFFEKCGLSQYSCGPRENIAIILYDYISERLDG